MWIPLGDQSLYFQVEIVVATVVAICWVKVLLLQVRSSRLKLLEEEVDLVFRGGLCLH